MGSMFFVLEFLEPFLFPHFCFSQEDYGHLGMLISFGLEMLWYSIHVSQNFSGWVLCC